MCVSRFVVELRKEHFDDCVLASKWQLFCIDVCDVVFSYMMENLFELSEIIHIKKPTENPKATKAKFDLDNCICKCPRIRKLKRITTMREVLYGGLDERRLESNYRALHLHLLAQFTLVISLHVNFNFL